MTESRRRHRRPTTAIPVNGAELRRLRIERGIEIAELAEAIGVGRPFISKLELGEPDGTPRRASVSTYGAIMRFFGIEDPRALRADVPESARVA